MPKPSRIFRNKGITLKKDSENESAKLVSEFVSEFVEDSVKSGITHKEFFQLSLKKASPELRRAIKQRLQE